MSNLIAKYLRAKEEFASVEAIEAEVDERISLLKKERLINAQAKLRLQVEAEILTINPKFRGFKNLSFPELSKNQITDEIKKFLLNTFLVTDSISIDLFRKITDVVVRTQCREDEVVFSIVQEDGEIYRFTFPLMYLVFDLYKGCEDHLRSFESKLKK